ncbi:MAG: DUF1800 domain-containing protein [Chloroflexi bacterium]|nr:DUF1800 domain-containing protein [Chloroflexota bacterium]
MTTIESRTDELLIAHLLRRAGFGGTATELRDYSNLSYEVVVDKLLNAVDSTSIPQDVIRRYHIDQSDLRTRGSSSGNWLYQMVTTDAPFIEKVNLFWHRVFATGQTKLIQGKAMETHLAMLRKFGLGKFDDLLLNLSKDPAMILWLDNQDNHKASINENYGREILELFAMGVGNYTEEDVKECSRAFTGWTVENTDYMALKMRNNTMRPYGYVNWQFKFDPDDHDNGEKTFLGETGNFNGDDIIAIICKNPATAGFIARHLYHYFVADELPVPQWPHFPPINPEAIQVMSDAYFDSGYSIKAMLRALFLSDSFKSKTAWNARVKSPIELVVGTVRLAGGYDGPSSDVYNHIAASGYMGQDIYAPPSVEGWMGGADWISTGSMVMRVNFAGEIVGNLDNKGVRDLISTIKSETGNVTTPESLVRTSLANLGNLQVSDETREGLVQFASSAEDSAHPSDQDVASLLQLIVATREYQFV